MYNSTCKIFTDLNVTHTYTYARASVLRDAVLYLHYVLVQRNRMFVYVC